MFSIKKLAKKCDKIRFHEHRRGIFVLASVRVFSSFRLSSLSDRVQTKTSLWPPVLTPNFCDTSTLIWMDWGTSVPIRTLSINSNWKNLRSTRWTTTTPCLLVTGSSSDESFPKTSIFTEADLFASRSNSYERIQDHPPKFAYYSKFIIRMFRGQVRKRRALLFTTTQILFRTSLRRVVAVRSLLQTINDLSSSGRRSDQNTRRTIAWYHSDFRSVVWLILSARHRRSSSQKPLSYARRIRLHTKRRRSKNLRPIKATKIECARWRDPPVALAESSPLFFLFDSKKKSKTKSRKNEFIFSHLRDLNRLLDFLFFSRRFFVWRDTLPVFFFDVIWRRWRRLGFPAFLKI